MKVCELAENLKLKVYTAEAMAKEKEVQGCYIGDLLSLAMSKVETKNVWITIQTNINIVAVASLSDASCIIIADGFVPDDNTVEKANEQDVVILGGEMSAFEIAAKLANLGI